MAATKLSLYQDALRMLADARLSVITDDVESRYALDDAWTESVNFVLRGAGWQFALVTAALSAGGTPAAGYTNSYTLPAKWLRTHALFVAGSGGLECPLDMRHEGIIISTNVASPIIRYVSADYADPAFASNPWPEHFARAVAAYLAFSVAERVTGERSSQGRMSEVFSEHLGEAIRIDALPDSPWLRYQSNGDMLRGARDLLSRAAWRFALTDAAISVASGTPAQGYLFSYAHPEGWLVTHKLFVISAVGEAERPFDIVEQGGFWSTNAAAFKVRYVSAPLGIDSTKWPEPFRQALLSYLNAGLPVARAPRQAGQERSAPEWLQDLALAISAAAEPPDPWLRYQFDGSFRHAAETVMRSGFWVFRGPDGVMRGLREVQLSALADQLTTDPAHGFPYRYPLPADWLTTHALFVPWDGIECPINIRESVSDWSTDAATFVARYVGTDVLDTASWPELVVKAVRAWLDWRSAPPPEVQRRLAEYDLCLRVALEKHSRPPDDWLRHQLDGSYQNAVARELGKGRWRFAVKTVDLTESSDPLPAEEADGTPSNSYAYRFIHPNDMWRTLRVYWLRGTGLYVRRNEIDFRDEGGAYHANYTPITVRYVSRLGLDSTKWSAHFRDAVLAWLQYAESRNNAAASPSLAAAKLALYEAACREAEGLDDTRDRVSIRGGRITAARRGRSPRDRENAWY